MVIAPETHRSRMTFVVRWWRWREKPSKGIFDVTLKETKWIVKSYYLYFMYKQEYPRDSFSC